MKDKGNIKKNSFLIRVYDEYTLQNIQELFSSKRFESMNELLNKALKVGAEQLLIEYGKRGVLTPPELPNESAEKQLAELKKMCLNISSTMNDLYVVMTAIEELNVEQINYTLCSVEGQVVTKELFESGAMSDMTLWVRFIKDEVLKQLQHKK